MMYNEYTAETSERLAYDPAEISDISRFWIDTQQFFDNSIIRTVLSGLQMLVGAVLMLTGLSAGFGAMLFIAGAIGIISNAIGSEIGGGLGTMVNGYGAISTGISMMSYGTVGIAVGIGMIAVGGATMLMGANEVVTGIIGTNYISELIGEGMYDGIYTGLNILSAAGTVIGRFGMRIAGTTYNRRTEMEGKPYGRNIYKDNIYYFDSYGKPSWSHHHKNRPITGEPSGQHWHMSWGRDRQHIYSYCELLIKLIFGGK